MRLFSWRFYIISAFVVNFVIAVIMWSYLDTRCYYSDVHRIQIDHILYGHQSHDLNYLNHTFSDDFFGKNVVVVIRDFEMFENDLTDTVKSIVEVLPLVKILLVSDKQIYPPVLGLKHLLGSNVHQIVLKPMAGSYSSSLCPDHLLDRDHILIVPDAVRFESKEQVASMFKMHHYKPRSIIAAPVAPGKSVCLSLNISIRHWTLKYKETLKQTNCDALQSDHVMLIAKSLLIQLIQPFARPFPHSLFIQSSLLNVNIEVLKNNSFKRGKELFTDAHMKWKRNSVENLRKQSFYQDFGIKKVLLPAARVEWYGCNKSTPRCFGTVANDMPEYLFEGRWTPPCCLENLRKTGRYVFSILEKCNVRYWLEGGSLLGAVRTGDIIPWDYDIDVGIYKEDISKCEWLKNAQKQTIVDNQGFVWEKATEGDFIRVQFSQTNHLHVDIFPFYSKNGIMTKDTWFVSHKQDKEFPEHFLQPLQKIKFIGVHVSIPNKPYEFVELKFGKGSIETPKYPIPELLPFSRKH